MTNKMEHAIFLNRAYNGQIPYDFEVVRQLNFIPTKLRHDGNVSIDEIVDRQRAHGYLSSKQVVVLYPTSGRFNITPKNIFPYNMDPDRSMSILLALQFCPAEKQQAFQFDTQAEEDGKENRLINTTLEYLAMVQSPFRDARGRPTFKKVLAAKE